MTILLVAVAMVAIIGVAALSIDIITLYLAREQAQRSADAAALAAARVIAISGLTGDTSGTSWASICGGATSPASLAAIAVATQSEGGGTSINPPTVKYSAGTATANVSCSAMPAAFAVNPLVTVQISRTGLPTFFSRIWGNTGNNITVSATAEAFNPSDSGVNTNGGPTGAVTPVQPSCVKPWVVPNSDPLNPPQDKNGNYCGGGGGVACNTLVNTATGAITHPGILQNGGGIIGENFWLLADCRLAPTNCTFRLDSKGNSVQPEANYNDAGLTEPLPNLLYVPNQVGSPVVALPSCTLGDQSDPYQQAIEGCDSPQNYQCGAPLKNTVDLQRNPRSGTTLNGVMCLTRQSDNTDITSASGQDYLAAGPGTFGQPTSYPFQILAGSSNPLSTGVNGSYITASNSIVSLPIYDNVVSINNNGSTTAVTFVGFLQVFINAVDSNGNVNVTVLNVVGCSNNTANNPISGSSPVPVRLITPQ